MIFRVCMNQLNQVFCPDAYTFQKKISVSKKKYINQKNYHLQLLITNVKLGDKLCIKIKITEQSFIHHILDKKTVTTTKTPKLIKKTFINMITAKKSMIPSILAKK